MAEVLVDYTEFVFSPNGTRYLARACGSETTNGTWQGWLEFVPPEGGDTLRTGRETTQPNRTDTLYWATGLTAVYLEGALERALHPHKRQSRHTGPTPFGPPTEPVPDFLPDAPQAESVLNPFSVYRKGETLLRRQLAALSVWHLVNIIRAHALSDLSATTLESMEAADLIEIVVSAVKKQNGEPVSG
jgi:hypothetical protein